MTRLRRWRERDEGHRSMGLSHEFLHWLREPAEWGRQKRHEIRHPVFHWVHLVPAGLMERMCARAERKRPDA